MKLTQVILAGKVTRKRRRTLSPRRKTPKTLGHTVVRPVAQEYPEDKYFPSYLLLGRQGQEAFHVLFGTDVDGHNVRIITAYYPSPEEWEADLKRRRRSR